MMYFDNGHSGTGWGIAMMLMVLVFLVLLAMLVIAVFRGYHDHGVQNEGTGQDPNGARHILDERLARGDIDTEEYGSRLDALLKARV
jgi:putative membrane protein